jgi:predicted RecB family nuclease
MPTLAEHGSSVIFGVPFSRNTVLGIEGAPDAVAIEHGTLAPVEVKSHRRPTTDDQIELCFYWDLLTPWRTASEPVGSPDGSNRPKVFTVTAPPHGYLVLPTVDGGWRMEHVWLSEKRFEEMRRLVKEVRHARNEPPPQRICDCPVCSRLFRNQIQERAHARGDLTLIWGIGRHRALVLETAGIPTVAELRMANPEDILAMFRAAGPDRPGLREVEGWIHHAVALIRNETVVFESNPFPHSNFIALDLEYDSDPASPAVYLAGVMVVNRSDRKPSSFWADPGEEAGLLQKLAGLLAAHPEFPVVTWDGESADGIELKKACDRADVGSFGEEFQSRHVDLYRSLRDSVRFPISDLKLKSLAEYLGIATDKRVLGGIDTVALWRRYRQAPGSDKAIALRRDLIRYNAQDVSILASLAKRVHEMTARSTI